MCTLEKRKSLSLNFKNLKKEKQVIAKISRRNNMQAEIHRMEIRSSTKKKDDETNGQINPEANRVVGLQEHLFASLLQMSGNSSFPVLDIYCRSGNNLTVFHV